MCLRYDVLSVAILALFIALFSLVFFIVRMSSLMPSFEQFTFFIYFRLDHSMNVAFEMGIDSPGTESQTGFWIVT